MFDAAGNMTRAWILYLEQRGQICPRTLLIKDTTVGTDIADRVTIYRDGTARKVEGVLRKAISADLAIAIRLNGQVLIAATIPLATAVGTVLIFTQFAARPQNLADGDVLSWDILASDGSDDAAGIASFTLLWSR